MPRLKHPDPHLTYACPECDLTSIWERDLARSNVLKHPDKTYLCEKCGHGFDAPRERPIKDNPGGPRERTMSSNVNRLLDLSPEEVGLSGGGD